MTTKEKNIFIYKKAIEYLWENSQGLTQEIFETYLDDKRKTTMNEVFQVAVFSFRDWNPQFGKSGITEHTEEIKALFKDFDLQYFNQEIRSLPDDELDALFKKAFGGSNNAYKKVKENVCDSAKYLSEFKNVTEMYSYFDSFDSTKKEERDKLIQIIVNKVKWWGAALVPNWLKDIGMSNYSKPDDHVKFIISNLGLSSDNEYDVMEAVFRIAEDYKSVDDQASAFKLDRILWLIGSGNFYNHKGIVSFNGNRTEFVEMIKTELNKLIDKYGDNMRNIDKFRGCLIGGAAGDALGYAVEFKREDEIFSEYGKDGITEYDLILDDDVAEISDDTQMTLFTAEGMLLAGNKSDTPDYIKSIREMYQCWYQTQSEKYTVQSTKHCSHLMRVPELFHRRCPGMTCMTEIKAGANGTVEVPINDSKGCGGVMRVAPIGLFFTDTDTSYEESDMLAAEAAALTHGHDLGFIPAAALAHIVRAVSESEIPLKSAVNDSIIAIEKLFPAAQHIADFSAIMRKAVNLAETEKDVLTAIHQLGEGWVAEETLAIAVYCALRYEDDFNKAMITAVNHDGDSDSTGAVCGNILGAYIGYNAISQKYKERLELHDVIIKVADNLCYKS